MLPTDHISGQIQATLSRLSHTLLVEEVRIGLGYIGVRLEGGRMGLAAVLRNELGPGCSTIARAGQLAGARASDLLDCIVTGNNPLEKGLGLATANALLSPDAGDDDQDSIALMKLSPQDIVAMVGYFGPLVERIEKTGAKLHVIEKDPQRTRKILQKTDADRIIGGCSVAIITATSILNESIEEILNKLEAPRYVAILGPSTPLCEEAFARTPVTHLGGSAIENQTMVMKTISEGGGTPQMRPYLRFIDRTIDKDGKK